MNTVHPDEVRDIFGKCYAAYCPDWRTLPINDLKATMAPFKYHLEREAGVKLDYELTFTGSQYGFKINQVEIVDGDQFFSL